MTPTAAQIFRYADRYARRHEVAGRGTRYPTLREAAKRFGCSYDALENAVSQYEGDGYLGIAVAIGGAGGYADLDRCDQLIEAYAET